MKETVSLEQFVHDMYPLEFQSLDLTMDGRIDEFQDCIRGKAVYCAFMFEKGNDLEWNEWVKKYLLKIKGKDYPINIIYTIIEL